VDEGGYAGAVDLIVYFVGWKGFLVDSMMGLGKASMVVVNRYGGWNGMSMVEVWTLWLGIIEFGGLRGE
jgi:hypothetical protein